MFAGFTVGDNQDDDDDDKEHITVFAFKHFWKTTFMFIYSLPSLNGLGTHGHHMTKTNTSVTSLNKM